MSTIVCEFIVELFLTRIEKLKIIDKDISYVNTIYEKRLGIISNFILYLKQSLVTIYLICFQIAAILYLDSHLYDLK